MGYGVDSLFFASLGEARAEVFRVRFQCFSETTVFLCVFVRCRVSAQCIMFVWYVVYLFR